MNQLDPYHRSALILKRVKVCLKSKNGHLKSSIHNLREKKSFRNMQEEKVKNTTFKTHTDILRSQHQRPQRNLWILKMLSPHSSLKHVVICKKKFLISLKKMLTMREWDYLKNMETIIISLTILDYKTNL